MTRVATSVVLLFPLALLAKDPVAALGTAHYRETILPILQKHCYDCHADGARMFLFCK